MVSGIGKEGPVAGTGQRSQSSGSDSGRRDASTERERRNVPKHAAESPENTVTVVGGLWPTERRQPPGQAPAKARARDIAPVTSMYDESQRLRVYGGWIVAHEPSCLNLRRRPQLGDDAGRSVRRSGSQPARYIRLVFLEISESRHDTSTTRGIKKCGPLALSGEAGAHPSSGLGGLV